MVLSYAAIEYLLVTGKTAAAGPRRFCFAGEKGKAAGVLHGGRRLARLPLRCLFLYAASFFPLTLALRCAFSKLAKLFSIENKIGKYETKLSI